MIVIDHIFFPLKTSEFYHSHRHVKCKEWLGGEFQTFSKSTTNRSAVASAATGTTVLPNCESHSSTGTKLRKNVRPTSIPDTTRTAPEQAASPKNQQKQSFQPRRATLQYTPSWGIAGSSFSSNITAWLSRDGYWSSSPSVKESSANFALFICRGTCKLHAGKLKYFKQKKKQKKQKK